MLLSKESLFKPSKHSKKMTESSNSPKRALVASTRKASRLVCFTYNARKASPIQREGSSKRSKALVISKDQIVRVRMHIIKYDFVAEYGNDILMAFHQLETKNGFSSVENRRSMTTYPTPNHDNITHLSRHKVSELSRGRMVDWMFEVLNAFKMSDQTFFLAVQYMDRFLENTPNSI